MRIPGIPYVQGRNSYSDPDGKKFGIAIHNTSNTASAEAEASYATRRTDGVSSHFYCDADSVIQSLDTTAKAGHAGSGSGNNNAVAVEITGTNDRSRDWWLRNVAWDLLGEVLAQVCRAYSIQVRRASVAEMTGNPQVRAFYSHDDMRRAWGGTTHTDPGPGFPWDRLFGAVNAALGGATPTEGDDMAGEIADKALAALDGSNALGEVYLRLMRGAGASGEPSGDGAGENNLTALGKRIDALTTAVGKLASPAAVDAAAVARELITNPAFKQLLVDAANAAEDS